MYKFVDQSSDRSGTMLVKMANKLNDKDLAERALNIFFNPDRNKEEQGMFKSAEDVLLSSVYFAGQKEKMEKTAAEEMENKLEVYRSLYNITDDFSLKPLVKTAAVKQNPIELFNGVTVSTPSELQQAGVDFLKLAMRLTPEERTVVANNYLHAAYLLLKEAEVQSDDDFVLRYEENNKPSIGMVKEASANEVGIPESIILHSATVDSYPANLVPRTDIIENIHLHKAAALRRGENPEPYEFLQKAADEGEMDIPGLFKLAEYIDELAEENNFGYDKVTGALPTGKQCVFCLKKVAEDVKDKTTSEANTMDKATIVARFGEGALDEIEDPDGSINKARLREIIRMFGGEDESGSNNTTAEQNTEGNK